MIIYAMEVTEGWHNRPAKIKSRASCHEGKSLNQNDCIENGKAQDG